VDIAVYKVSLSCKRELNLDVVKETMDLYLNGWLSTVDASLYVGYITESKTNFRLEVAKTWKYKGQRKSEKPKWYEAMREYVVEHWGCQLVTGMEADDALTIAANRLKLQGYIPIIVTEDKDLLQWPGLHYNPNKSKEVFEISEGEGHFNLWHQVITGDRTDNIPGVSQAISESRAGRFNQELSENGKGWEVNKHLYKRHPPQELFGKAGATKYLQGFYPDDYPMAVLELYIDKYEDLEDEGSEGYGELRFYETFALIFMLRECPEHLTVNSEPRYPPVSEGIMFMEF